MSRLHIFTVEDPSNEAKLKNAGASIIDVIPQGEGDMEYVVEIEDGNTLAEQLFGQTLEEATEDGSISVESSVEEDQEESKEAENEAVEEAKDMVDEAGEIVNSSTEDGEEDSISWSAPDDYSAEEDSELEVVDTNAGKLLHSDGYVLGYCYEDNAADSVKPLFGDNIKLASAIKTALLTEDDNSTALAPFGFEPYKVELDKTSTTELAAKKMVAKVEADFNAELTKVKAAMEQTMAMGLLATVKGINKPCILKQKLVASLEEAGAENADEFVDDVLSAETMDELAKDSCAAAYDYLEQDENTRDEVAKTIEASAYAKAPESFVHKKV